MYALKYISVLLLTLAAMTGCGGRSSEDLLKEYRKCLKEKGEALTSDTIIQIQLLDRIVLDNDVPVARELITDKEGCFRHIGCVAAARLKDAKLIPELVTCLEDSELYVSNEAAYALTRISRESVSPSMAECRKLLAKKKRGASEDWALFHCFLVFHLTKAREAAPLCIEALADKSKKVRYAALGALGAIEAKEALTEILAILGNAGEPELLRVRAARIVADWNAASAAETLTAALKDEQKEVCRAAAKAFGKMKSASAIPILIEIITDKSGSVATEAIRGLYFQTGEKLTHDFLCSDKERREAQKKWRDWWEKNKDKFGQSK